MKKLVCSVLFLIPLLFVCVGKVVAESADVYLAVPLDNSPKSEENKSLTYTKPRPKVGVNMYSGTRNFSISSDFLLTKPHFQLQSLNTTQHNTTQHKEEILSHTINLSGTSRPARPFLAQGIACQSFFV